MFPTSFQWLPTKFQQPLFISLTGSVVLADGPVYDGQGNPINTAAAPADNFLTQTVYGFLDFTTTIGNTVMVFSPQSAPPPGRVFYYFCTSVILFYYIFVKPGHCCLI